MKIGFISPPAPGHFNPMSAVARQLQSRNHDVVVLSLSLIEPLVRAANLPFIPFGEKEFPDQLNAEILGKMGQLKGEEGLQFGVDTAAKVTKVQWRELPKLLPANDIDVVVLDNYAFYGEVVPMYLGMPYAILANALHFDYSGYTPLCVYGWGHEKAPQAQQRNRQGVSEFAEMLIRSNAEMIAEVEKAGIKPNWTDPCSLIFPGSRNVLANLTLKALIGPNSSSTPVRSMTERAGQGMIFRGTN
jgi:zeaxanthin glucosyltransferase